ncbi:hypothetical protein KIN20_018444 [Parelaphostrongylus tenuis]|uniref:Uncharacterized protein n=1 Tax=Parelaphostrongylus tenuis TaxID=148309 RepID=A0AAD5MJY9_PARTN|nr:hypothetical protein KIN20_018444 [Parelaphostrongylus tenuis]
MLISSGHWCAEFRLCNGALTSYRLVFQLTVQLRIYSLNYISSACLHYILIIAKDSYNPDVAYHEDPLPATLKAERRQLPTAEAYAARKETTPTLKVATRETGKQHYGSSGRVALHNSCVEEIKIMYGSTVRVSVTSRSCRSVS